jgi:LEA14-like dessication related protein
MENATARRVLLLALLSLALPSCAFLSELLKDTFQQPAFNFKSVAITDVSLGGLTLDTLWQLDNPNSVGLSLAQVEYALFVEEKQVVAGSPPQGFQLAPNGSTELHFPAQVKFQDLAGVVETFLTKDKAHYRVSGAIGVQTPIGVLRFPLEKQGDFDVPKAPRVMLENPRLTNVSLAGATVEFPLILNNPNAFPLPVSGLTGTISVGGAVVGRIDLGEVGLVPGHGTRRVAIPLQVSFFGAGTALAAAVQGGPADVKVEAQLRSGTFSLPVRLDQAVNFVR